MLEVFISRKSRLESSGWVAPRREEREKPLPPDLEPWWRVREERGLWREEVGEVVEEVPA